MNKVAEKTVAVMNDEELKALIDDHYAGEAQTLTTGAGVPLGKTKPLALKRSTSPSSGSAKFAARFRL